MKNNKMQRLKQLQPQTTEELEAHSVGKEKHQQNKMDQLHKS